MSLGRALDWGRRYVMVEPSHFRIDYAINPFMHLDQQPDPVRARVQWRALADAIEAGIRATGDASPMRLLSKAGHDAMAIASLTDYAMLFIRCKDGVSHHHDEDVRADDVALALDAFEAAVLSLAHES